MRRLTLLLNRHDRPRGEGRGSGELGFVDKSLDRFQLAAHGQIVGWVKYPKRLERELVLASRRQGTVTLRFRLGLTQGRLMLLSLVG